jgi:hypothetical protein
MAPLYRILFDGGCWRVLLAGIVLFATSKMERSALPAHSAQIASRLSRWADGSLGPEHFKASMAAFTALPFGG